MAKNNVAQVISIQSFLAMATTLLNQDPTRIRHGQSLSKDEDPNAFDIFTTEQAYDYWKLHDMIHQQYEAASDIQGWKRGPNRRGTSVKDPNSRTNSYHGAKVERIQLLFNRKATIQEQETMTMHQWLQQYNGDPEKGLNWSIENAFEVYPLREKKDAEVSETVESEDN